MDRGFQISHHCHRWVFSGSMMPGLSFVGGTQGAGEMLVFIIIPKLWSPSSTCPEMPWTKAKTFGRLVDFVFFRWGTPQKKSDTSGRYETKATVSFASTFLKCKNQLLAQTFDCWVLTFDRLRTLQPQVTFVVHLHPRVRVSFFWFLRYC